MVDGSLVPLARTAPQLWFMVIPNGVTTRGPTHRTGVGFKDYNGATKERKRKMNTIEKIQ